MLKLPIYFHNCNVEDISNMVSEMLNRLIAHNDFSFPLQSQSLSRFHSRASPSITIQDYLRRISKYANIEKSALLLILIYIDRICVRKKEFTMSSLTSHRFIISAITIGSKSISDVYCTNSHFAKVGGISVVELNMLELEFCTMIDWKLAANAELMQQYYVNLVRTSGNYSLEEGS